jgi:hypothetical protein
LLESSEREKNKIKSRFDKIFPVEPVATSRAFFWGEKNDFRRGNAKVGAENALGSARGGGLEGLRGLKGDGGGVRGARRSNGRGGAVV